MASFYRVGGLAGLVFVVAFAIAQVTSAEPSRTASQEEITRYFAGNQTSNQVGGLVVIIVSGLLALFAVAVWSLLRSGRTDSSPAWSMTGLVGGVVMAVNLALLGSTIAAEGWLGDKLAGQPVLAQTVFVYEQTLAASILPFIALLLLGMGIASLESKLLPTWSAWLAFAGAVLSVVLTLELIYPGSAIVNVIGGAHAVVTLAWIATASVFMLLPDRVAVVASPRTA